MKRTTLTLAILLATGSAYAASDFIDTAQVVSSKPIIERVADTRQECNPLPAPQKNGNSVIAPIIGGVVGGLLGHQVGQGRGQTAATIAGATGGAVAGSTIGNRAGSPPEQQCRTVETSREVVNGYDVVYRYNGRDVNVALPYNPGSTIKVGVSAMPDDRTAEVRRDERDNRQDVRDSRPPRHRGPPY